MQTRTKEICRSKGMVLENLREAVVRLWSVFYCPSSSWHCNISSDRRSWTSLWNHRFLTMKATDSDQRYWIRGNSLFVSVDWSCRSPHRWIDWEWRMNRRWWTRRNKRECRHCVRVLVEYRSEKDDDVFTKNIAEWTTIFLPLWHQWHRPWFRSSLWRLPRGRREIIDRCDQTKQLTTWNRAKYPLMTLSKFTREFSQVKPFLKQSSLLTTFSEIFTRSCVPT